MLTLACGPNDGTSSDTDPTTTDPGTTGPTTTDPTEATMSGCERVAGSGELAWSLRCGGPSREEVRDVSVDAVGNIYVGIELRPADLDKPTGEPFHIGDFEIGFESTEGSYPSDRGIAYAPDGAVVIIGSFDDAVLDLGGGPLKAASSTTPCSTSSSTPTACWC